MAEPVEGASFSRHRVMEEVGEEQHFRVCPSDSNPCSEPQLGVSLGPFTQQGPWLLLSHGFPSLTGWIPSNVGSCE